MYSSRAGSRLVPDDIFVDPPRLVLGKQAAGKLAAVDHQDEVLNGPLFGQRKEKLGLELERTRIMERLGNLDLGNLVAHPAVDADLADLVGMRRSALWGGGR